VSCVCLQILYFDSIHHLLCNCRLAVDRAILHISRPKHYIVFNYDFGRLIRIFLLLCHLEGPHALTAGSGPSGRYSMGFASTPDGMLYVFGGRDSSGTEGGGVGLMGLHGAGCAGRSHAAEGARVGREETCTRACMSAACQWGTHASS
jgi:hypothetical protein